MVSKTLAEQPRHRMNVRDWKGSMAGMGRHTVGGGSGLVVHVQGEAYSGIVSGVIGRQPVRLKRIAFAIVTALTVFLAGGSPKAQQATKVPRVGFLNPVDRSAPHFEAFRQGLADLGYVEGRNIAIEPRFAEGQYERFPDLLAELVRLNVDIIAVTGAVTARAAKKAVTDIPIVFAVVVDPVADNVVPNLERPGGNLTGTTSFDPQQAKKQLELLKEMIPVLRRVALLGDQGVSEALMKASEAQAQAMGLQTLRLRVAAPNPDLEGAFAAFRQEHADALLILEEPVVGVHATRIAELAARSRLPTMFAPSRVGAGGLLAYGTSQVEAIRRMAVYVDKVLKGANPGELSVERVTPYELILNLTTARDIGITMPPEVLKRADRVIQ
jgi:putative tryptophan/tyrosine transport system substrate-binding protein